MLRNWLRRLRSRSVIGRGPNQRKRIAGARWFDIQVLEQRALLSAAPVQIAINSGVPLVLRDGDGSAVRITLTGPGSGSLTLTNGGTSGGQLDTLTLNGTNGLSSLQINSFGGTAPGSQINKLLINKAVGGTAALGNLDIVTLDLSTVGLFQADGDVGSVRIGNLLPNSQVSIAGNVSSFTSLAISTDADVHFGGTLSSFTANSMAPGSDVSVVDQLNSFYVKGAMDSAQLLTGIAGFSKFTAGNVYSSMIYSVGAIGSVTVQGDLLNTNVISNVFPGSDGVYGTKDDIPGNNDVLHQGGIASVTVFGNMTHDVVESVGAIGTVTVGSRLKTSSMSDSLIISNATPGADGIFGTLDDVDLDPEFTRDISTVMVYGPAGGNIVAANGRVVKAVSIGKNEKNLFVDTPFSAIVSAPSVSSSFFAPMAAPLSLGSAGANTVVAGIGATIPLQIKLDPAVFKTFTASQVYISVYGFLNTPGQPESAPDEWYLTPTGFERTANLPPPSASTADQILLPTYSLDQFTSDSTHTIWTAYLPVSSAEGLAFSGRILISAGIPVQARVSPVDHTVTAPSTANPTDAATGSFTDFLEFTVNPPHYPDKPELFIDTSQVDWFGLPLTLQIDGTKGDSTSYLGPVGVVQPRVTVNALDLTDQTNLNNYQTFINKATQTNPRAAAFAESYTAPASGVDGGVILATTSGSPIVITTNNVAGLQSGDLVTIKGVQGNSDANGTWKVGTITPLPPKPGQSTDGVIAGTFTILKTDSSNSAGTSDTTAGGVWYLAGSTPIRLVAPKDLTAGLRNNPVNSQAQVVDPLNTYFDQAIDQFFLKYFTGTINTPLVVSVSDGGSGYTTAPTVTFSAPTGGGTTATGTAVIKDGKVTGVIVTNEGSGYTTAPTVTFSGGSGSGATATVKNTTTGGGQTLKLTHKGKIYNGAVVKSGDNYVMQFVENGAAAGSPTYNVLYPFFTTNLPTPNDQASDQNTGSDGTYTPLFPVAPAPKLNGNDYPYQYESPSQMIFACDGSFADGALYTDATAKELIGDFENQISAALNRGVALDAPAGGATAYWQNNANWFPQTGGQQGVYNYWAQFFHQDSLVAPPARTNPIKYPLAYAFAFDDQGGASSTLHGANVNSATITLLGWGSSDQAATTTTLSDISVDSAAPGKGPYTLHLTAKVASTSPGDGVPQGTLTFFVNGVPLNTLISGEVELPAVRPVALGADGTLTLSVTLPALPNLPKKDATLTFPITAVYSGDSTHLPSVGLGSVTRASSSGNDVNTTQLSLYSSTEGQSVKVTATATVGSNSATAPSGTVDFNLLDESGAVVAHLASGVTVTDYIATATFDPSSVSFLTPPAGAMKRGTYTIQSVFSGGGTSQATFTVKPTLVATQLAFDAQPPAKVTAGTPMKVVVSLRDTGGAVLPIFGGVVTLTAGTPGTPAFTATAAVINGVATFSVKDLTTPGTGYKVKASFTSATNGNPADIVSSSFDVIPLATLSSALADDTSGGAGSASVTLPPDTTVPPTPFFVKIDDTYQFVVAAPPTGTWSFLYKIGPKGQTHSSGTAITVASGIAGLNQDLDDSATTFEVNAGFNAKIQGFPAPADSVFLIQIDEEIMQVKSHTESGDHPSFTVVRAYNGTSAAVHANGSVITLLSVS